MGNRAPASPTRVLTIAKVSQTYSITSKYISIPDAKIGLSVFMNKERCVKYMLIIVPCIA